MKKDPITIIRKIVGFPSWIIRLKNRVEYLENRVRKLERTQRYYYHATLPEERYAEEISWIFLERTGKRLDLNNPRTFNEKIQWFKLYGITPEITALADKYKVREYVAERIGEQYLVPLLGHWRYPEEIDFSALPDKFVLKANHGCGYNYIVQDKSKLDIKDCITQANRWLREDYSYWGFEMQYHNIERLLIAEQFLEKLDGYEYKVWCFNGRAEYIRVMPVETEGHHGDFYDRDWKLMPFNCNFPNMSEKAPKPDNLDEMLKISEALARKFAHVRVDLYRTSEGRLYFGEMTFTSSSGINFWNPPETDLKFGELFDYPGMNGKE